MVIAARVIEHAPGIGADRSASFGKDGVYPAGQSLIAFPQR